MASTEMVYDRECMKRYYERHKDKLRAKALAYAATHRKQRREYDKEYSLEHKDEKKIRDKERWQKLGKDKQYAEQRKQCRRKCELGTTNKVIRGLNKRDWTGYCELCGKENTRLVYHHWDDNNPSLGIWVCIPCHWLCEMVEKKRVHLIQTYLGFKKSLTQVDIEVISNGRK